ncbi:AbrB/MazE/SpoVT family DNA-binding domain-containing protein [Oleomonas cavernae]|uniref:AbrB/MazE/SpoVT family DNA-binding domain-containing protein n=1 Tax=Oleomonas cavernae TaxID=2320859 RepID=A0A418VTW5_9PROT|nr:AbrB/MazE/SpoVT family DNA-binding domain-containing protein [Oleomonas cavernae]RJF80598.1 AbrB/MazE/SpoVT family DNA-binding domain-containing protein [Oleomonas cavernae]
MSVLTITAKGRITLPADILEHLGIQAGEKITLEKLPGGRIEVRAARPATSISAVFGLLRRDGGPTLSIEEMNEIAKRGPASEQSMASSKKP